MTMLISRKPMRGRIQLPAGTERTKMSQIGPLYQKTYSSAVTNSIRNTQQTRATFFAEVQQEQAREDAKKEPFVKGTKPSDLKKDATIVQELAKTWDVKI